MDLQVVINKVKREVKNKFMSPKPKPETQNDISTPILILPYKGDKGNQHVVKLRINQFGPSKT